MDKSGLIIHNPFQKFDTKANDEKKKEIIKSYNERIYNAKSYSQKLKLHIEKQIELLKLSPFQNLYDRKY